MPTRSETIGEAADTVSINSSKPMNQLIDQAIEKEK